MRLLYEQDQLPVFQNRVYDTPTEARDCPKGNIRLVEDTRTGLVYNAAFQPDLMVYDGHYQNEQAVSPHFQQHLEDVARIISRTMGRVRLIEVGCGKGYFLEMLLSKGYDITGFDPTYEGVNERIKQHYFKPGSASQADGLILRHVLEHIQDPVAFLNELKVANGGKGKIYIEVPCFDWICKHRAWFDIFYEHVNYFRLPDFHRIFGTVVESGWLFGGQYLYAVGELETLRSPVIDASEKVDFPADFTTRSPRFTNQQAKTDAIWGAASKGVIFALLSERAGRPINTVIDINPAKQGKHLPATGLLVRSPEDALPTLPKASSIYVMNSNYLNEIKQMSNNVFNYIRIDHE